MLELVCPNCGFHSSVMKTIKSFAGPVDCGTGFDLVEDLTVARAVQGFDSEGRLQINTRSEDFSDGLNLRLRCYRCDHIFTVPGLDLNNDVDYLP